MFSDMLKNVKEIFKGMLPKKSIESVFHITPAISNKMTNAIQLWSDMYVGESPWVREPSFEDPTRIVSLGLPAMIASEKARMVVLEMKSEITTPETKSSTPYSESEKDDSKEPMDKAPDGSTDKPTNNRADFLNSQYVKLKQNIRKQLEYGIAKGGLIIKPYVVELPEAKEGDLVYDKNTQKYKIEFDYVQADRFYPLSFDANGKVTEAVFVQTKVDGAAERVYTRLEYHRLEGQSVVVENRAFVSQDMTLGSLSKMTTSTSLGSEIPLKAVKDWENLEPKVTISGVDRLLFAYFKMPEANTIDPYSPLGVSGYSRVIQLIKDADMQYSRLLWEFEAGEMAIDVDRDAMQFVEDPSFMRGGKSMLPTKQQRLFRKVDLNNEETYNVFAPALRDESLVHGLNVILMRIEDATGLSRGTMSDVDSQDVKTATELKILKQRSFATNADIQMALQEALEDTVYIMDVFCDLYDVTPSGEYNVSFEWDDSIIMDTESELTKRITLMQNGLASKLETRMWYFGETESQAMEALKLVEDEAAVAMERNAEAAAKVAKINPEGAGTENATSTSKSPADNTSDNTATGKQADNLDKPNKSKDAAKVRE